MLNWGAYGVDPRLPAMMSYRRRAAAAAVAGITPNYYNAARAAALMAPGTYPGAIPNVYGGGVGVNPGIGVGPGFGVDPGLGWPPGPGFGGVSNAEIAINAKQTVDGVTTRRFSRRQFDDPFADFMTRRMRRMRRAGIVPWNRYMWG